ncbi:MAG TPA: hypothetical protein PK728_06235 [Bacillota bacterium]|nr:hypothetical protein [Bacillota bacterium]
MKYKLVVLVFFLVVGAGTSAVLSQFNRMIYPAGPFSILKVECGGPGFYRVEFLGEKALLERPLWISGPGAVGAAARGAALLREITDNAKITVRQAFDRITAGFNIFRTGIKPFVREGRDRPGH